MKNLALISSLALLLAATSAIGQTTPPSPPAPPASTTVPAPGELNKAGAPKPGANSFTEAQAKSRIEAHGITGVGPLTKDSDGIWRGKATRNGASVDVAVDYEGNVVAR